MQAVSRVLSEHRPNPEVRDNESGAGHLRVRGQRQHREDQLSRCPSCPVLSDFFPVHLWVEKRRPLPDSVRDRPGWCSSFRSSFQILISVIHRGRMFFLFLKGSVLSDDAGRRAATWLRETVVGVLDVFPSASRCADEDVVV